MGMQAIDPDYRVSIHGLHNMSHERRGEVGSELRSCLSDIEQEHGLSSVRRLFIGSSRYHLAPDNGLSY